MSGIRRRVGLPRRALVAASACALLLLPGLVTPVAAAWNDVEHVRAPVRLTSGDCTETGLYTASASSALLAGTVQGARIGAGALGGVSVGPRTDAATSSAALRTADAGATPVVGGVALPMVLSPGGSWTQSATASGTGASSASIGGSSALGTIGVSDLLARSPSSASLLPGLSGVVLAVGVPSAAAAQDACAAGWGAANTLTRTSALSATTLGLTDAAVGTALGAMRSHGTAAGTALTAKASSAVPAVAQAAATALTTAVGQALSGLGLTVAGGSGSATVAPATAGIAGSVQGSRTDSSSTLDSGTGVVSLDLLAAAGSGSAPDVDLVTAPTMTAGANATVRALRLQAGDVAAAVRVAREGAPVSVTASATVSSGATALATVAMSASGTAADWAAGRASYRPVAVTTLSTLVALPSGLAGAVGTALASSTTIGDAVSSAYLGPAAAIAPDAALTADADAATTDLRAHLAALPAVLTATAGLRATDGASSWAGSLAAGTSMQTALRVRVVDGSGARADLFIGNVSVGPDRPVS